MMDFLGICALILVVLVGVRLLGALTFKAHKDYLRRRFRADLDRIDREYRDKNSAS